GVAVFRYKERDWHADDDALAAAALFARGQRGPSIRLFFRLDHRSSSQKPIRGLINSIPNSQPSARSIPRHTITPGFVCLLTIFVSWIACVTSRFIGRTTMHP